MNFSVSILRFKWKIQEICTVFRTKWLLQAKSIFSVTSLGSKHILNSFGELVLRFSEVIFWYIIPGFFQHFPEFIFRFRLSFICFLFKWSHTASIIFKSVKASPWLSAIFLSKYDLTVVAVYLGSLSCWKINPFPITHSGCFPEGMA